MNRTRQIFFGMLAIYLVAIAAALALDVATPRFIQQLFIGSTIFSVGVVLLDFLGILGGHHAGDTAGDVTAGHIDGAGGDGSHLDAGHLGGDHGPGGHEAGTSATPHAGSEPATTDHGAHPGAEQHLAPAQQAAAPILSVLSYLRLFVYFCLGFGPTGWAALVSGRSALVSLGLAIPVGLLALFLAQAFFRFQRHDTDSQVRGTELVGRTATVIVPLDDTTMGRVRIQVGPTVSEQFALAAGRGASFEKGAEVTVTSVTDACVYVR